jgi:glycosyltransferase involved in cell wall biosynthesis
MSDAMPLISCVCLTRRKPALLSRAIDCFLQQTYLNKELLILYEDDDAATEEFVHESLPSESGIRLIRVPGHPKTTLGELRNVAIRNARGEFVCQWDDDDWYHIRRLEEQYDKIVEEGGYGSIMTRWLVFDSLTMKAYISNKRLWEGSILCRKSVLQLKVYEDKELGEDTATIEYLERMDYLRFLNETPGLYIYVYHGNNSWSYDHWSAIFRCSTELPAKDSEAIADILQGNCSISEGALLIDGIMERAQSQEVLIG